VILLHPTKAARLLAIGKAKQYHGPFMAKELVKEKRGKASMCNWFKE
jgi:hypothetical protein